MEKIKAYCQMCNLYTNQVVHAYHKIEVPDEDEKNKIENEEYLIIQCLGCDHTSFLKYSWDSEEEESDKYAVHFTGKLDRFEYYEFLSDEDHNELPKMLYWLYEELKSSLIHDAELLGTVGMRMLIEATCNERKIQGNSLKDRIKTIYDKGLISRLDYEVIDRLREIGNVSAHEIKKPSESDIDASLEAVNHLLRTIYITHKRTKRLRKKSTTKS